MGFRAASFFAALLAVTAVTPATCVTAYAGTHGASPVRIYTFVDADGVKHFTDTPDDNRYRLLVLSSRDLTHSGEHYDASWTARARQYDSLIETAAASASVEANLLRAVIVVESGFNPHALSPRGAVGLMQLMPATASRFGVTDLYDARENIRAGASYLKFLMARFRQDKSLVLAAYNAGEEAVTRNGGRVPPFAETLAYVPKVLRIYRAFADRAPALGSHAGAPLTARLAD